MDVVEWFTFKQRVHPVDQPDVVDLQLVELVVLEDPVFLAGCGVAVLDTPAASIAASLASIKATRFDASTPVSSSTARAALGSKA